MRARRSAMGSRTGRSVGSKLGKMTRKLGNGAPRAITKSGSNRGTASRYRNSSRPKGMSGGRGY